MLRLPKTDMARIRALCLFYCDGGAQYGSLLIYIVGDPGAQDFLSSPGSRPLPAFFEQCADQFIHFGTFET